MIKYLDKDRRLIFVMKKIDISSINISDFSYFISVSNFYNNLFTDLYF